MTKIRMYQVFQMSDGDENKSDKKKMFDNDYENFIKSRNEGIPVSTNRA